jgi:hypothetical protein
MFQCLLNEYYKEKKEDGYSSSYIKFKLNNLKKLQLQNQTTF